MNVIDCRVAHCQPAAAILALKIVTREEIEAGKRGAAFPKVNKAEQPNNGRNFDGEGDRAHFVLVSIDYFDLPQKKQRDRPFPGDYLYRLVASVQE